MRPALSVIVIVYDMLREAPRTLESLSRRYQQEIGDLNYEVIVVDNGSSERLPDRIWRSFGSTFKYVYLEGASPSPAAAINHGFSLAAGENIGIMIDGARLATPGLLIWAARALQMAELPVVATAGWHLGPDLQWRARRDLGYNQKAEDRLLRAINWPNEGYRLFEIGTPAGSTRMGWLSQPAESNAVFVKRTHFASLGGYDERFSSPGGGLVNHDFWQRACWTDRAQPVMLLGEGTFHQLHGGATTSREDSSIEPLLQEYERVKGVPYRPSKIDPWLFGRVRPEVIPTLESCSGAFIEDRDVHRGVDEISKRAGLTAS